MRLDRSGASFHGAVRLLVEECGARLVQPYALQNLLQQTEGLLFSIILPLYIIFASLCISQAFH
jgi:hypothetical protein